METNYFINFDVNVVECNSEEFRKNYSNYIVNNIEDDFDNVIYELIAPKRIYNEIKKLEEEGIEIIN